MKIELCGKKPLKIMPDDKFMHYEPTGEVIKIETIGFDEETETMIISVLDSIIRRKEYKYINFYDRNNPINVVFVDHINANED